MTKEIQNTLVLIKPDGVKRGLIGEILRRIEAKGYEITAAELVTPGEDVLRAHYAEHVDRPFFPGLLDFMTSGPIFAAVVSGHRVIEGFRSLAGATDPTAAAPGTIRGDLGRDWDTVAIQNLVHGSDSPEAAAREIGIWF